MNDFLKAVENKDLHMNNTIKTQSETSKHTKQ